MSDSCEHCKFYKRHRIDLGICRRRAPVSNGTGIIYPTMEAGDWCGEFELVAPGTREMLIGNNIMGRAWVCTACGWSHGWVFGQQALPEKGFAAHECEGYPI